MAMHPVAGVNAVEADPVRPVPPRRRYLALGAVALAVAAFWLGARLGPVLPFGTSSGLNQGTWLPTPAPAKAYISGAVRHAGLYTLAPDARLAGLLRQAGGPARCADLSRVDLAADVHDGETITIARSIGKACGGS